MKTFKHKKVIYGISKRDDGSMKLFSDLDTINSENRKIFFNNIDINNTVAAEIKNSYIIKRVTNKDKGRVAKNCDGLITKSKNLILSITVADCVPIYFFDSINSVIGIAHAGWKGVVGGIVKNMLDKFKNEFNSKLNNVNVFIGPHIKECHFEVKKDVAQEFSKYSSAIIQKNNKIYINLAEIIKTQLLKNGVDKKNIKESRECTYCEKEKYFSYRRDKIKPIEAMVAYIGLKEV